MKTIDLYTDGACSGNPGPGGWGCILKFRDTEREYSGFEPDTTNNRMELTAVIKGLENLKESCIVNLYSDSKYIIDALEKGWARRWKANGWVKGDKNPALNSDLWEQLLYLDVQHKINPTWVKGHSNNEYNNRCDELAVGAVRAAAVKDIDTMDNMTVYCDNAATTRLSKSAYDAMLPWMAGGFGNASGFYKLSREAKAALQESRKQVAECLGVEPDTICFTSSGTESNNWALKSALENGGHLSVSAIEHHSVTHPAEYLKKRGCGLSIIPVDEYGVISLEEVAKSLNAETKICSIILANNEIGTIQPIEELAKCVKSYNDKILFHTDAVQAVGHIPINITPEIDMLSISAHKFGGPKGVGALYIKKGLKLTPLLHGGGHERGRRSSTENIAGVVGLSAALVEAVGNLEANTCRTLELRTRLIKGILEIPYSRLTGHSESRLPGNASFVFASVEGECLVMRLDYLNVAASSGSACSAATLDPSHVLLATGLSPVEAHGSLRLTISHENTEDEIDYVIKSVKSAIERCREMSPLWQDGKPCDIGEK